MKARLPATVLSNVNLNPEVPARYTFTCELSDPGGVVGINPLSVHTEPSAIIRGDGRASANPAFLVPVNEPSTERPVLVLV